MTRSNLHFYFKLILFTVFFWLACGFQTSFWPHLISFLPGPQIWLLLIFFLILKWPSLMTVFYIYFLGFSLTQFSQIPLKMVWSTLLITYFLLWTLKSRVQLTGVFSFMLYCLIGSFLFQMNYVGLSQLLEKNPTSILFLDRLLQILMNFIASYFCYFIFNWLNNRLSQKTDWTQSTSAQKQEYDT